MSNGKVINLKKETFDHINKFFHTLDVDYENGKIINKRTHLSGNGYFHFSLHYKKITVHSLIAFMKYGDEVIGLMVNHKNGIKTDNRPSNIELTTNQDNIRHAVKLGLMKPARVIGERHGKSKLTKEKVIEIRKLLKDKVKQRDIAKLYGISQNCHANKHKKDLESR